MIPIPRVELSAASLKLILGIACALALALLVHDRNRWRTAAAERQYRLEAERTAHAGTIAQYRAAADRARSADRANAERVTAEQAAINERTADDYQNRLVAARAAALRLRVRTAAAAADSSARRAAPVPGISAAAGEPVEAARQNRLSVDDSLIATEQAIQLDELIEWVRRQAAVDVNGASGPAHPASRRGN